MLSGVYGMYFYALAVAMAVDGQFDVSVAFVVVLGLAVPLAVVLLLALPAGLVWTAVRLLRGRGWPTGWRRRALRIRVGLEFAFAVLYGGGLVVAVAPELSGGWWSGWDRVLMLLAGALACGLAFVRLRAGGSEQHNGEEGGDHGYGEYDRDDDFAGADLVETSTETDGS